MPKRTEKLPPGVYQVPGRKDLYGIRWTEPGRGGKRRDHRKAIGTLAQAKAAITYIKGKMLEGTFLPPTRSVVLLGDFIAEQMEIIKPKTRDLHSQIVFARTWTEDFGDRDMETIDVIELDLWRTRKKSEKKLSDARCNRYLAFLSKMYNAAIKAQRLKTRPMNPVAALSKWEENNQREKWLTIEQLRALFAAIPPQFHVHIVLAIETGLRVGSMVQLRWKPAPPGPWRMSPWVDFDSGFIVLPRAKHNRRDHVPMSQRVIRLLEERRGVHPEWVFPKTEPGLKARRWNACGPDRRTGPFWKAFQRACATIGLEDFHWHDLRHAFASVGTAIGVPTKHMQRLMTHKTPEMLDRYAHLAPGGPGGDSLIHSVNRISEALSAAYDAPLTTGCDADVTN